jgi:hypothetical protein
MTASAFASGGSSIVAEKKIDALVNGIVQLYKAERSANKDSVGTPTQFVTFSIAAGAQQTFTAAVTLPARQAPDANGKLQFTARDFVRDYFTYEPGTEDLADTENLPQALVEIADQINYWEKQIENNVVINQANQVTVTPNKDLGTITLSVTLPCDISTDATTGKMAIEMFDYLFVVPE